MVHYLARIDSYSLLKKETEVAAVCDLDVDRAKFIARIYGVGGFCGITATNRILAILLPN